MLRRKFSWKLCCLSVPILSVLGTVNIWLSYKQQFRTGSSSDKLVFDRPIHNIVQERNGNMKDIIFKTNSVGYNNFTTPYKFYVYTLPPKFNKDLVTSMQNSERHKACFQLDTYGMGPELFRYGDKKQLSVRNTHQFALEVIIHHKLILSPYRTYDPEEADIFYIPAYIGLSCILYNGNKNKVTDKLIEHLFTFLKQFPYLMKGRPHFTTVGKIQREMATTNCPLLKYPDIANITLITIEKEQNTNWLKFSNLLNQSLITAPYPAYVHFVHTENGRQSHMTMPSIEERNVFVFLAAGSGRSKRYRTIIMNQFPIVTRKGYNVFYNSSQNKIKMVKLQTDECEPSHRWTTIPWMQHSTFCLQPPGDSPTRKSFFDGILSGCIPVLFPYHNAENPYPFQSRFNYSQFTVTIPYHSITKEHINIFNFLKKIPAEEISAKYNKLNEIAHWFQYTLPDGKVWPHNDAIQIILDKIGNIYHFNR